MLNRNKAEQALYFRIHHQLARKTAKGEKRRKGGGGLRHCIIRLFVDLLRPLVSGRRYGTANLLLPHCPGVFSSGIRSERSSGDGPLSGVQFVEFSRVSRRSKGGVSGFDVIFLDRHGRLWECMMKWWVAAPSGPEKLDDGEPRRYGKTTTITHLLHHSQAVQRGKVSSCTVKVAV
ncbi:hypothetical protein EVAR_57348_1 [Eumeta japonica]|uniref:Uncharacterized protein n=1 Tax=Eumeta variegata TaxID=151549 RepID=A0A4C1Z7B3_EUMVA|nr:hypothetical protein EVAR_57348_1 [Eumeta japonica]